MKKLISFAGTGKYIETTYSWGLMTETTSFVCEAFTKWLAPDEILVVCTPTAEEHDNWKQLQLRVPKAKALRIPEPKGEGDLMEIFRTMSEHVTAGDEVILDVTHAFRALPVIALVTASYLQALKGVKVPHILYGAFTPGSKEPAPVIDLSLFLQLQQWTMAAASLRATGDARLFGSLLSNIQNELRAEAKGGEELPTLLKTVGRQLEQVTDSLFLTRPDEMAQVAPQLLRNLEKAEAQFDKWALPFMGALDVVKEFYEPLAGRGLACELSMVQRCAEYGHYVQAVTLGREWLVSYVAESIGPVDTDLRDKLTREKAEEVLNHATSQKRGELRGEPSAMLLQLQRLTDGVEIIHLWSSLGNLRNDLAHCGMRKQPLSVASAKALTLEFVQGLKKLGNRPLNEP